MNAAEVLALIHDPRPIKPSRIYKSLQDKDVKR